MDLTSKILMFLVALGAVNIITLLIIKSKARKIKANNQNAQIEEKSSVKVLNYEDDQLICMVENNLELEYGYECTDIEVFKNMKKTHRNIYSLLWFNKDVVSGGLGDYFFGYGNITMDYIKEALEDIKGIEILDKYKKILSENDVINSVGKLDKRSVEEYSIFMSKFDFSEFNNFYNHKNIERLIAEYIRKNICDFSNLTLEELKIIEEINSEVASEEV